MKIRIKTQKKCLAILLPLIFCFFNKPLQASSFDGSFKGIANDSSIKSETRALSQFTNQTIDKIELYISNHQNEKANQAIEKIIDDQTLTAFNKENALYQLIHKLKAYPQSIVAKQAIQKLTQYQAVIRLPHHDDHARLGVLQFNIAGAAKATLRNWQRNDYKLQYQQSIINQPDKIISLFLSANSKMTPQKKGALDAILTSSPDDLSLLKTKLLTHYLKNESPLLNPILLNTTITLADVELSSILLNYDDYYAQQLVSQLTNVFNPENSFSLLKLASAQPKLRSLAYAQMSSLHNNNKISDYLSEEREKKGTISAADFALKLIQMRKIDKPSNLAEEPNLMVFTENDNSGNNIALGYKVPMPKESLTPLDGFRSYQSLKSYHQSIAENNEYVTANNVGSSIHGETIWTYALSDNDITTAEGIIEEAAVMIDGGIHAREWQTPEVVSATLERLANNSNDKGFNQYLLENLNILITPVINVDGFIQTQKYPDQVMAIEVETGEPDYPVYTKLADGRLRRKNRLNVDTSLSTFDDNQLGVDLNRNFGPEWGVDDQYSSPDNDQENYRGSSAYSEPESQAVLAAAELGPANRLRYYTNTHSFTCFYSVPYTNNHRRNQITEKLGRLMIESTYAQESSPRRYEYYDDVGYNKAGFVAEHFAETYQIPSYILEVEPYDIAEYFFTGFMLPDTKIRALSEKITTTTLLGFYHQAGPAIVESVEIYDTDTNEKVFEGSWNANSSTTRTWEFNQVKALVADTSYQLKISFNKPMRYRNTDSEISNHPGVDINLSPTITFSPTSGEEYVLITSTGKWLNNEATSAELGYKRYQDDSYLVEFSLPSTIGSTQEQQVNLQFNIQDLAGMSIDANPATVVDWVDGAWSNYEGSNGELGDEGGTDKTISLQLTATKPIEIITVETKKKSSGGSLDYLLLMLICCSSFFIKRGKK